MKKLLCAFLTAILLLTLSACGGAEEDTDFTGENAEATNVIEVLIREGNALYKKGEKEAAKLVFDRVAKLMNAKTGSPEELLSSVNLDEKLSDAAKEMIAAYYLIENDGTEDKPSLPDRHDWGDK